MQGTPSSLSRAATGHVVESSTPCPRCGYDLKGLRSGDRCPECASPIVAGPSSTYLLNRGLRSSLTDAAPHYLRRFALGSTLMMLSVAMAVLTPVLLIVAGATKMWSLLLLVVVPFACWPLGVWMVTTPRVPGISEGIDHQSEWRRLRLWTRITQCAWPFAALAWWGVTWYQAALKAATAAANALASGIPAAGPAPTPPPGWLQVAFFSLGWPAWLTAFAGLPLLSIYLSRIADWANDTELANRLLMSAWGIVAGPLLALVGWVIIPAFGPQSIFFLGAMFGNLGVVIFILCFGQMGLAVFQCWNVARWAVENNAESFARDQRMAERARTRARAESGSMSRGIAPTPAAMPENLPKFMTDEQQLAAAPKAPRGRVIQRTGSSEPLDLAPEPAPPQPPPRRHPPRQ